MACTTLVLYQEFGICIWFLICKSAPQEKARRHLAMFDGMTTTRSLRNGALQACRSSRSLHVTAWSTHGSVVWTLDYQVADTSFTSDEVLDCFVQQPSGKGIYTSLKRNLALRSLIANTHRTERDSEGQSPE